MIVLCVLVDAAALVVLARIVLSWVRIPPAGTLATFARWIHAATEPVLGFVRSVLPPVQLGSVALDLSAVLVLLGLALVSAVVC